jgi:hypothetical protein
MIADKKVIILVMCASNKKYTDYLALEKTIKQTWFNIKNINTEIIFYKGNDNCTDKHDIPVYNEPDLILPVLDGLTTLNKKTLMAFEWVNENYNYEYIYRSNLGAYVDTNNLVSFLKDKPLKNFYCGVIERAQKRQLFDFASGAGYFLSRDLIKLCIKYKDNWPEQIQPDDQTLGYFFNTLKIPIYPGAYRKNICNDRTTFNVTDTDTFVPSLLKSEIYHVRLRSHDRKKDIENMQKIYKLKTTI